MQPSTVHPPERKGRLPSVTETSVIRSPFFSRMSLYAACHWPSNSNLELLADQQRSVGRETHSDVCIGDGEFTRRRRRRQQHAAQREQADQRADGAQAHRYALFFGAGFSDAGENCTSGVASASAGAS